MDEERRWGKCFESTTAMINQQQARLVCFKLTNNRSHFSDFEKKIATHLRFLAFCIHSEFKLTMSVYAQTTFSRRRRLIVISLRTVVYHCLLPVVHFFFFPDPFGESRSSSPTRTRRARADVQTNCWQIHLATTMPNLGDVFPDFEAETSKGKIQFHQAIEGS